MRLITCDRIFQLSIKMGFPAIYRLMTIGGQTCFYKWLVYFPIDLSDGYNLIYYGDHVHFDFIIWLMCNSRKMIELASDRIGITSLLINLDCRLDSVKLSQSVRVENYRSSVRLWIWSCYRLIRLWDCMVKTKMRLVIYDHICQLCLEIGYSVCILSMYFSDWSLLIGIYWSIRVAKLALILLSNRYGIQSNWLNWYNLISDQFRSDLIKPSWSVRVKNYWSAALRSFVHEFDHVSIDQIMRLHGGN